MVRYEYRAENVLGMIQIECAIILLRYFCDELYSYALLKLIPAETAPHPELHGQKRFNYIYLLVNHLNSARNPDTSCALSFNIEARIKGSI